ncbi:hypothetical protein AV521_39645 [Streptomyces sp. IMTB 2501]|nr:hypothetical protein AV521_39645 [Streptomyces sp. IMTB 2501]
MSTAGTPEDLHDLMPQLKLGELQSRIDRCCPRCPDRADSLLGAALAVGREVDLKDAPCSIVEAAATLVDAEYAGLGGIEPGGRTLSGFHTVGVTDEQVAEIGALPRATASSAR